MHNQPAKQWVPGLFPRVQRPGRGVNHSPPRSGEVKERVELYLPPPILAFLTYYRANFTFTWSNQIRIILLLCPCKHVTYFWKSKLIVILLLITVAHLEQKVIVSETYLVGCMEKVNKLEGGLYTEECEFEGAWVRPIAREVSYTYVIDP